MDPKSAKIRMVDGLMAPDLAILQTTGHNPMALHLTGQYTQ